MVCYLLVFLVEEEWSIIQRSIREVMKFSEVSKLPFWTWNRCRDFCVHSTTSWGKKHASMLRKRKWKQDRSMSNFPFIFRKQAEKRWIQKCDHCGKDEHVKAMCFEIIGYLSYWILAKGSDGTTSPEEIWMHIQLMLIKMMKIRQKKVTPYMECIWKMWDHHHLLTWVVMERSNRSWIVVHIIIWLIFA